MKDGAHTYGHGGGGRVLAFIVVGAAAGAIFSGAAAALVDAITGLLVTAAVILGGGIVLTVALAFTVWPRLVRRRELLDARRYAAIRAVPLAAAITPAPQRQAVE